MFDKLVQSNARCDTLDKLIMTMHSVRMPVSSYGRGMGNLGRTRSLASLV